jgi:cytochrome c peroxidase
MTLRLFNILLLFILLSGCNEKKEVEPQPTSFNFDPPVEFGDFIIPQDNPLTKEGVALGRMLFYEPKLSGDNTISCASCHQQKYGFADDKRFSKGIMGQEGRKNSMALANLLWDRRFFWDGRSPSLEKQVLEPIMDELEMHQSLEQTVGKLQQSSLYPIKFKEAFGSDIITSENISKAISQFIRTMVSSNSKFDKARRGEIQLTDDEEMGQFLFFTHPIPSVGLRGGNCGDCHTGMRVGGLPGEFGAFHNNGLDDDENLENGLMNTTGKQMDKGKFKAPSLRNIALTAPYMHDGRFNTLEEVLDHYNDHIKMSQTLDPLILEASNEARKTGDPVRLHLTDDEKRQIIAFLKILTDHEFITDSQFSNPFKD